MPHNAAFSHPYSIDSCPSLPFNDIVVDTCVHHGLSAELMELFDVGLSAAYDVTKGTKIVK
jgi:hypothetical protein